MSYINAFWVGGLICALVQIILEKTKMMPGRTMVLLVCTGAVLGAIGVYGPFQEFAGAGASVPMGGFKASAVGISAALILSYLASLIFDPKMQ